MRVGLVTVGPAKLILYHGPFFVLGVFVTVISLERAVALGHKLGYVIPTLSGLAALSFFTPLNAAPWLYVITSLGLCAVNGAIIKKQSITFTWLMLAGAMVLFSATVLWAIGYSLPETVGLWLAFFIITILSERLELSRLAPTPPWAPILLTGIMLVYILSNTLIIAHFSGAHRVAGLMMVLLAVWQLRFDIARITIRRKGLAKYVAVSVFLGIFWLLMGGVLLMLQNEMPKAGPVYDAILHCIFVGFVLSMVFAHAPIIFPAVAQIELPYHPALYAAGVTLHSGLVLRVSGDLLGITVVRQVGSALNALALVAFFAGVLWSKSRSPQQKTT